MSPQPQGERIAALETTSKDHERRITDVERNVGEDRQGKVQLRIAILGLVGVTITAAAVLVAALLTGGHP